MTDEIEAVTETAKAIQEVIKFAAKMFGTVPEDLVGITFGDILRVKRIENFERICRKAQARLAARGVEEPEAIDLKHHRLLLEVASEESDETLQDMWANLIANAMDPDHTAHFQKIFIETLKEFEPIDAALLKAVNSSIQASPHKSVSLDEILKDSGQRVSLITISLNRMRHFGCLKLNQDIDDNYREIDIKMTPLGEEIVMACDPNGSS